MEICNISTVYMQTGLVTKLEG